jgi:hypothetical protein
MRLVRWSVMRGMQIAGVDVFQVVEMGLGLGLKFN